MPEIKYFEYGEAELSYLKSRDSKLAAVIDELGHIERAIMPDLFTALVNSIIAQQISSKALETIWQRFCERFEITPETIGAAGLEELQSVGITFKKAEYIRAIAREILSGGLDLNELHAFSDAQVCERLVQIRGIGVWTAEMLMTFSMQRRDIMSFLDIAILRGLRMIHHHRKITPELFAKYKRRYSPCGSIASLYIWAVAEGACPAMRDFAPMSEAQKRIRAGKRQNR